MTFPDLKAATEKADKGLESAHKALADAESLLTETRAEHAKATQAKADAHKAMHDWLTERGATSLVDAKGAILVYLPCEQEPGWYAVQPIPGKDVKVK